MTYIVFQNVIYYYDYVVIILQNKNARQGGECKMCNEDIRNEIRIANVKQWEVADAIGISEMTMVKWLRKELSPDKKELIRKGISEVNAKHAAGS